jgi:hypothetical protein
LENLTPPKGLSKWARGVFTTLTAQHEFQDFELVAFERALRWWDVSDKAGVDAAAATGGEAARLSKLSIDASSAAVRHWRLLKFTGGAVRRPGRPSGDAWSQHRKLAAGVV